jgi:reactive intermediate/imine deaminase
MQENFIFTSEAPTSSPYSQAVKAGDFIDLSDFVGVNPETKEISGQTIEEQTRQAIQNSMTVLGSAGYSLEDVVQCIVLLRDIEDFDGTNKEYARFFKSDPPTRILAKLGVNLPNVKVSIAMTAFVKSDPH